MDISRRNVLKTAAALLVDGWASAQGPAFGSELRKQRVDRKVVILACGGIRREETFSMSGLKNIPHLVQELGPRSVFYPSIRNAGVTAHYNTTSSILTGNWERVDDWGKTPPTHPTLFEYLRKHLGVAQDDVWLISSNKALTNRIGASSVRGYGPDYGANVVFPKQLLIDAVVQAAKSGHAVHSKDRATVQPDLEAMLNADSYEGLGWTVNGETSTLNARAQTAMQQAIRDFMRTSAPATGDEFTYLVAAEVMRRFAPSLLVMSFSDMEVAHFGSYSMHLSGIRTVDRLAYEMWNKIQSLSAYRDKTTLFILPEFGRDLDGSTTNGFFNHRQDSESTRLTWMACLGDAASRPQVIEEPVMQTDICPTVARIFGLQGIELPGRVLPGLLI